MSEDIIRALEDKLGHDSVAVDGETLQSYGGDWTRFESPDPLAIVFVRSVEQVVDLVEFANERGVALVPSGGRTGLSGGAVASRNELVVSFEKMNRILDFDPVDKLVRVEAGVVTAALQEFARDRDLYYPVDFASSGSSQIGGNIATNAGGVKVLRYGLTRDQIYGLKVVTGRGDVLELNRGLVKNATGYDLRHLFIGLGGHAGVRRRGDDSPGEAATRSCRHTARRAVDGRCDGGVRHVS